MGIFCCWLVLKRLFCRHNWTTLEAKNIGIFRRRGAMVSEKTWISQFGLSSLTCYFQLTHTYFNHVAGAAAGCFSMHSSLTSSLLLCMNPGCWFSSLYAKKMRWMKWCPLIVGASAFSSTLAAHNHSAVSSFSFFTLFGVLQFLSHDQLTGGGPPQGQCRLCNLCLCVKSTKEKDWRFSPL